MVHDAGNVEGQRSANKVLTATRVTRLDISLLEEVFAQDLQREESVVWNDERERVETVQRLSLGILHLEESRQASKPGQQASAMLFEKALEAGFARWIEGYESLQVRLEYLQRHSGLEEIPDLDEELLALALEEACAGLVSFSELEAQGLDYAVQDVLGHGLWQRLGKEVPTHIELPGGRRLLITYPTDKEPWVQSYLQDFFGMEKTPALCAGRLPLTLHLLAPNRRPVQVTQDLSGFWQSHYPELRKSLGRRYPRHAWPEDPVNAEPPVRRGRR